MRRLLVAATLLAFTSEARAEDYSEAMERAARGVRAVRNWQAAEARGFAEEALRKAPEDPATWALVAALKFHHSDYDGAVQLLRRAKEAGVPAGLVSDLEAAEAVRVATVGYAEHVSEHFIIRYRPGRDEVLVPYALETLNAARSKIGELLGWTPQQRVVLELYPSAKTLARVSSLTPEDIENSGTIALCRWNRLMATTPRAVVFGYSWRDTLAHELAHLIIGGASKNTVPIYLHEGIAKYVETAWRAEPGLGISVDQEKALIEAAKKGKLIPFADMHPSMAKLPTQEASSLAFSEVFTFVGYLVERKGWQGIRQVLRRMAGGLNDQEAIAEVQQSSMRSLEKNWKKQLKKRKVSTDRRGPVKGDRKLEIKSDASVPDDALHGVSDKARRYARAADLLYARGRVKAAQVELKKALDKGKSPLIAAKLAMVALHNNDLKQAESAAKAALKDAPALAGPNVTLAEVLVRAGNPEAAKEPLARAIDINPFDPRIHRLMEKTAGDDADAVTEARRRQAIVSGPSTRPLRKLGTGGLIEVRGPPFHRVFLKPEGDSDFVATGRLTPTSQIAVAPGRYTLMLLPLKGPARTETIEVRENKSTDPQVILSETNGT